MEDKHCETLEQRVVIVSDLHSDGEDSNEKEKNQLARNSEAEMLAIDCDESEENQENQVTSADTRPLQDELPDERH